MCLGLARGGGHGNGGGGHGDGKAENGDGDHGQNYMYKAFVGMAAVAGFLALALIAFIGNKVVSDRKRKIQRQVWI